MDDDRFYVLAAKKLAGEASPAELTELEMILRFNPDLHYSLEALYELWEKQTEIPAVSPETSFEKHIQRLQAQSPDFVFQQNPENVPEIILSQNNHSWRWVTSGLIAVVLIFTAYRISHPALKKEAFPVVAGTQHKPAEIITQYGTRTKLLLPDGTTVWLNAGSRLIYDSSYNNIQREVSLTGEGFFDVVKNKNKPFLIHTGNINIRVLGTSFNVKSYPDEKTIETSLIRGRIEVSFRDHPQEKTIMKPNDKLIVKTSSSKFLAEKMAAASGNKDPQMKMLHLSHFGVDSLIAETAWVENKLVFQDELFSELAKKMERWYGVKIIFDDQPLDTLHFTGSFEKENIQQAIRALQVLSRFAFFIDNGEIHIQKTN